MNTLKEKQNKTTKTQQKTQQNKWSYSKISEYNFQSSSRAWLQSPIHMRNICRPAGFLCLPQAVALWQSYLQLHIWSYLVDYSYLKLLNSCSNYLHFWPPQCSMCWDSVMYSKKQGSFFLQGIYILNLLPDSFVQHLLALEQPFPPLLYFAHLLCHIFS